VSTVIQIDTPLVEKILSENTRLNRTLFLGLIREVDGLRKYYTFPEIYRFALSNVHIYGRIERREYASAAAKYFGTHGGRKPRNKGAKRANAVLKKPAGEKEGGQLAFDI